MVVDRSQIVESVGVFAVAKKSGKQRLIIDARPANFWFGEPDSVSLATGAAMSYLEVPEDAGLWVATADIADAFYNMMLPMQWRPYFTLPPLEGWRLGLGDSYTGSL